MKKTGCFICLGVGIVMVTSCVNYSGYVNSNVTHVYYAPETIDIYPAPTVFKSKETEQREALRYELFDMPTDRSSEWDY